jgi:hypothetical protein
MSDQYRRDISQLVREAASLRESIGKEGETAAKARVQASWKRTEAQKAATKASRYDALRAAASSDKRAATDERKLCELHRTLGANLERQQMKNWYLRSALRNEQSSADCAGLQNEQMAETSAQIAPQPSNL